MNNTRALRAIAITGLVVGTLDILSAVVIWWQRGVSFERGLQGIAAALLGTKSFQGGTVTAVLGMIIHFFIAFMVVTILYVASRKLRVLTIQPIISGVLYGIAVYLVMYWVVLPRAFPTFRHRLSNELIELAIHICLIGLPTALLLRWYSEPMEEFS
jgi:hypothetical protein